MQCPKCGKPVARIIQREGGQVLTPCCDGISEVGSPVDFRSPVAKQKAKVKKAQYDKVTRDQYGSVINDPNWQVHQDLIKRYKNNPDMLSDHTERRLRESGEVSEKVISQSQELRKKEIARKREEGI